MGPVLALRDGGGIRAVAKNNTGETERTRTGTRVAFGREGGPVRQSGGQPGGGGNLEGDAGSVTLVRSSAVHSAEGRLQSEEGVADFIRAATVTLCLL